MLTRAMQTGDQPDKPDAGLATFFHAEGLKAAVAFDGVRVSGGGDMPHADGGDEGRELLAPYKTSQQAGQPGLIVCPVQSESPEHLTVLIWSKPAGAEQTWQAAWYDSLWGTCQTARDQAQKVHSYINKCLGQAESALPQPSKPVIQADGWSCGYRCMNRTEEAYGTFRQSGMRRAYRSPDEARMELNKWVDSLLLHQKSKTAKKDKEIKVEKDVSKPKPAVVPEDPPKPALASNLLEEYGCSH